MVQKFSLTEFLAPKESRTISYEPWNQDDQGQPIELGQRCRVTVRIAGEPRLTFFADRQLAQSIIDFLDKIKEEDDAEAHQA